MQSLIVVGAGGLGRETVEAVRAVNTASPRWFLVGYLDDRRDLHGTTVDGLEVVGGVDAIADHRDVMVVAATGRQGSRPALVDRLGELGVAPERYATVVHPLAALATTAVIGRGSVILANVSMTAAVTVGRHVAVMPNTVLTHDVHVGDFATLASGVLLSGAVQVGRDAYLGAGALVREKLRIGDGATVGMGSVVITDVPDGRLWFGLPAADHGSAHGLAQVSTG